MASGKSAGRKKIEIVKIEDERKLRTTFSKRRARLFKKLYELATLTGAEVGVIAFSPTNKPFTYGCPDIESVLGKLKDQSPQDLTDMDNSVQDHKKQHMEELNEKVNLLKQKIEEAKRPGQLLDEINLAEGREPDWLENHIMKLSFQELGELKVNLEELKTRFVKEFHELKNQEIQKDPLFHSQNPSSNGAGVPFNNQCPPAGPVVIPNGSGDGHTQHVAGQNQSATGSGVPSENLSGVAPGGFVPSQDFMAPENIAGQSAFAGSSEGSSGGVEISTFNNLSQYVAAGENPLTIGSSGVPFNNHSGITPSGYVPAGQNTLNVGSGVPFNHHSGITPCGYVPAGQNPLTTGYGVPFNNHPGETPSGYVPAGQNPLNTSSGVQFNNHSGITPTGYVPNYYGPAGPNPLNIGSVVPFNNLSGLTPGGYVPAGQSPLNLGSGVPYDNLSMIAPSGYIPFSDFSAPENTVDGSTQKNSGQSTSICRQQ